MICLPAHEKVSLYKFDNHPAGTVMKSHKIDAKIEKLPEHLISEINDFIDFLLIKYGDSGKKKNGFKFDWEGDLSGLKGKHSSVDLQHKASEWR
jgi:hypothetical protein